MLPGYPHRMPTPVWLPPISTDPRIAGRRGCQAILGPKALLFSPVCMTLLPKLAPSQNIFSGVSCFPFSFKVSNLLHSKPHTVLTTLHCSFTTKSDHQRATCAVCTTLDSFIPPSSLETLSIACSSTYHPVIRSTTVIALSCQRHR